MRVKQLNWIILGWSKVSMAPSSAPLHWRLLYPGNHLGRIHLSAKKRKRKWAWRAMNYPQRRQRVSEEEKIIVSGTLLISVEVLEISSTESKATRSAESLCLCPPSATGKLVSKIQLQNRLCKNICHGTRSLF